MLRECNYCKTPYEAEKRYVNRGHNLHCSESCRHETLQLKRQEKNKNRFNNFCAVCTKPLWIRNQRYNRCKSKLFFCSVSCQIKGVNDPNIPVFSGPTDTPPRICLTCSKRLGKSKYDQCQTCRKENIIQLWLGGDMEVTRGSNGEPKSFVKPYVISIRGDQCEECGFNEKAPDGRSIIQMDHIDGDFTNNSLDNLKLLCPNHHAMTPTYGSLNKNGGRAHRRKKLEPI